MFSYALEHAPPDSSPGYLLRVVQQMSAAGLENVLLQEGVNPTQWMALALLHFGLAETAGELARHLAYNRGAMTRLVVLLEARGLVVRARDTDDRRIVRLTLTDAGRELALRGRRKVKGLWNRWLRDWDADEVETLVRMLQRLRATMEEAV